MPSDARIAYLAYGSNLHPRRLAARIGRVEFLGVTQLPGWELRFDKRGGDGSAKANLHPAPGLDCRAYAAVYAVDRRQAVLLDGFEGCGSGYETLEMTVAVDRRRLHGRIYLAPSQWIAAAMRPFDWYRALIVAGARYHGFDGGYIESIREVPSQPDPDVRRARFAFRTLELSLPARYRT